jgi:hypothetical protein
MDAEPTDEVIKRNNNGYGFCVWFLLSM